MQTVRALAVLFLASLSAALTSCGSSRESTRASSSGARPTTPTPSEPRPAPLLASATASAAPPQSAPSRRATASKCPKLATPSPVPFDRAPVFASSHRPSRVEIDELVRAGAAGQPTRVALVARGSARIGCDCPPFLFDEGDLGPVSDVLPVSVGGIVSPRMDRRSAVHHRRLLLWRPDRRARVPRHRRGAGIQGGRVCPGGASPRVLSGGLVLRVRPRLRADPDLTDREAIGHQLDRGERRRGAGRDGGSSVRADVVSAPVTDKYNRAVTAARRHLRRAG